VKKIALLIVITLMCSGLGGKTLYALENDWQLEMSNINEMLANPYWKTPRNRVVVGILSTGIDLKNPAFQNNLWEPNASHSCCGWNFVENNNNPQSLQESGNWVASFLVKYAPNIEICALRVTATKSIGASQFNRALEFASMYGIKILYVGFPIGGCFTCDGTYDAVLKYQASGGLLISCAGDDSISDDIYPIQPGSYDIDNVINVGAANEDGSRTIESNFGKESVDIFAPGKDVIMPISNGKTYSMNGTQASTAFVTAMAILASGIDPRLNYSQIRSLILETAYTGYPELKSLCATGGMVDFSQLYTRVIGPLFTEYFCINGYVIQRTFNKVFEEVKAIAIPYGPLEGLHTVYFNGNNPLKNATDTIKKLPTGSQCASCSENKPTN